MTVPAKRLALYLTALLLVLSISVASAAFAAEWFTCQTEFCNRTAGCFGDYASLDGCTVTCYKATGDQGWITPSGVGTCEHVP